MQTMIERGDGYCVVCLCDKDDFWSEATARARADEAEQRRKAFVLVQSKPDSPQIVPPP